MWGIIFADMIWILENLELKIGDRVPGLLLATPARTAGPLLAHPRANSGGDVYVYVYVF